MTVQEFSNEFEILYNEIATNAAPNIDEYEKSVYLTKAQLELVKNHFHPLGNKYRDGFEQSSKRRADLKELIVNHISTTQIASSSGISPDSKYFQIPDNVFLIIQESAIISNSDECLDGKILNVVPKTHDEYNIQKDNPFKKPNDKIVWRVDYQKLAGLSNVELISPYTISTYKVRYIKYPEPIVLVNLTTTYPGEGLTIDGVSTSQTCELNENIHREILDRAVELAIADYRPEMVAVKTQINTRNE